MSENLDINNLADVVSAFYRFSQGFSKMLEDVPLNKRSRYVGQFNWFKKSIEKACSEIKIEVIDITGQKYDAGMAVIAINLDVFAVETELIIETMIEPIIAYNGNIIKTGVVMLKEVQE